MKVEFDEKIGIKTRTLLKNGLTKCLKLLGQPQKVELSITVVDAKEMRRINNIHRNIYKPTDVLSFPAFQIIAGDKVEKQADIPCYHKGYAFLGDIVLCDQIAEKQAKKLGHDIDTEFLRLSIHSLLHLLGFDHMTEKDFEKMNEIEKKMGFGV